MNNINDVEKIVEHCEANLDIRHQKLNKGYYYQSLPLCVIDAIFSINAKYEQVQAVVKRYCDYYGLKEFRNGKEMPAAEQQEYLCAFWEKMDKIGHERFKEEIFNNRQRTSARSGITKAEAAFRFASVLKEYDIDYFQDISKVINNHNFENKIRAIPGQNSGISLKYFFMLAGDENMIKPDRMIFSFLESVLEKQVGGNAAISLLRGVAKKLKEKYPKITPRLLDNIIWKHQRGL